MSIIKRLMNIFRYRSHAALDRIEDPGAAARLKARDYAAEVAKFEEQLTNVLAEEKVLQKKRDDAESNVTIWKNKARAAVLGGSDELAKEALRRQAAGETQVTSLDQVLSRISVTTSALKQRLDTLRQAKTEAQTAAEVIDARSKAVAATEHSIRLLNSIGEGPTVTFSDLSNEVDRREAHAEALQDIVDLDPAKEFKMLESPSVESRLEELKAVITGGALS